MIATVNVGNEKRSVALHLCYIAPMLHQADDDSRAKMKKWFEKWSAEKAKRKEKNLPAIVDYRDETYVSFLLSSDLVAANQQW